MKTKQKEQIKTQLSRRMKVRMFELDLTMRGLSRKCGVPAANIGAYVSRKTMMSADALAAIADGLECSADWLLGRKEERE